MEEYNNFMKKFLSDLEANLAYEMEVNNIDFKAKNDLINKTIKLN